LPGADDEDYARVLERFPDRLLRVPPEQASYRELPVGAMHHIMPVQLCG